MTMFIAFILLVNAFVPLLFQCASKKRPPVQRPTRSQKSSRGSRSTSKSRRSSRSSRSNSRKSSKSRSKSVKSRKLTENPAKTVSNKKVRAAILADKKAAEEAVKPKKVAANVGPVDCEESKKISYANIRIIPHELSFRQIGGLKHVRVKNSTGKRIAYLVKCSDNMLFSINPVYGIIEPDRDAQINILRENGEAKHDKIVVITAPQPDRMRTAEETFNEIYNANSHDYNINVLPIMTNE